MSAAWMAMAMIVVNTMTVTTSASIAAPLLTRDHFEATPSDTITGSAESQAKLNSVTVNAGQGIRFNDDR